MFEDTLHYIPTVGWMFLPLTVYHGGGEAATFEPLEEHLLVSAVVGCSSDRGICRGRQEAKKVLGD